VISDVKPGMWVYQNLISHQNDYFIGRIDRIEKARHYYRFPVVVFRLYFGFHRYGRDLSGSMFAGESKWPQNVLKMDFSEVKRPRKEIKWAMIRAAMRALDK